ncbi:hypothetical protein ACOMHN_059879 [Nucella lapillus]
MLPHDYSLPERALGFWCPLTLGILAVTSLGLRYVTDPISCWTPREFSSANLQYTNEFCFHKTEIYQMLEDLPENSDPDSRPQLQHTYHQWVPFALGMGAILCVIPHVMWRMLSGLLWMDTHALAQTLADNQRHNAATRHVMLKDSALLLMAGLRGGNCMLTVAALARKVSVCVVCVLQMVLIVVLFDPKLSAERENGVEEKEEENSELVGEDIVKEKGIDFNASLPLPYTFLCDFALRNLLQMNHYTVQCMLPVTRVYSKAFAFLFYLFLLLAACCVLDLLTFLSRLAIPGVRDSRLTRYLTLAAPATPDLLRRFLDSLGLDGRLVVSVTADHCGPVAAADLTHHLWTTFRGSPRPAVFPCPGPDPAQGPPMVSTVPPPPPPSFTSASAAAPPPSASSVNPAAIPLLPMDGKGAQA